MVADIPLIVEFVSGSWLRKDVREERDPEQSFVVFHESRQVSLPTDQIVLFESEEKGARVGFGGMSFEGLREGELLFCRVKDLWPEEMLPSGGLDRVMLRPEEVSAVYVDGRQVWPR